MDTSSLMVYRCASVIMWMRLQILAPVRLRRRMRGGVTLSSVTCFKACTLTVPQRWPSSRCESHLSLFDACSRETSSHRRHKATCTRIEKKRRAAQPAEGTHLERGMGV